MSQLRFCSKLPTAGLDFERSILIYDSALPRHSKHFKVWSQNFPAAIALKAGEELKSLDSFIRFAKKFHRRYGSVVSRETTLVAVGGGSIGDFVGFFASVYKRGLRLVHIPSTWLSAFDSSHGGKTALNLLGAKNQIGTFFESETTFLVRELLIDQPQARAEDAMGELAKIAIISSGRWGRGLRRPSNAAALPSWLWLQLKPAVAEKMKIVRKDPKETKGLRQILNLGHSFGHLLEAEKKLTHGEAVGQGLLFALDMGQCLGRIKDSDALAMRTWLSALGIRPRQGTRLKRNAAKRLLLADKKRVGSDRVVLVLPIRWGQVERLPLDISVVVSLAEKLGWVTP